MSATAAKPAATRLETAETRAVYAWAMSPALGLPAVQHLLAEATADMDPCGDDDEAICQRVRDGLQALVAAAPGTPVNPARVDWDELVEALIQDVPEEPKASAGEHAPCPEESQLRQLGWVGAIEALEMALGLGDTWRAGIARDRLRELAGTDALRALAVRSADERCRILQLDSTPLEVRLGMAEAWAQVCSSAEELADRGGIPHADAANLMREAQADQRTLRRNYLGLHAV